MTETPLKTPKKPPVGSVAAQVVQTVERLGLSEAQAAQYFAVPVFTVRKWLTGEREPGAAVARLVVGASTPVPRRVARAEDFLRGKTVTAAIAREAADIVASDIEPLNDQRGSADYRRDVVRVVARRSIARLWGLPEA